MSSSASSVSSSASASISEDATKKTALAGAGLSADQVTFTKVKQDLEDGKIVYKFEFVKDLVEYSYTIDIRNVAILEKESEIVND